MNIRFENFQWVKFNQERIITIQKQRLDLFEFSSLYPTSEPQFYCQLLLKKLLHLNQALLPRFLSYQCDTSKYPLEWLDALESLLEKNIDELLRIGFSMRLNQIFIYLDKLKYIYASSQDEQDNRKKKSDFEIEKIKAHSKKLPSINEKKVYLLRQKTDYLQQHINDDENGSAFDKQIDLELNFLSAELTLQRDNKDGENPNNPILVWTGQVKQLVELFFQCLHETNKKGEPLLQVSNEKVIRFIIRNFKRADGSEFSAGSIRSLLKPSRRKKN